MTDWRDEELARDAVEIGKLRACLQIAITELERSFEPDQYFVNETLIRSGLKFLKNTQVELGLAEPEKISEGWDHVRVFQE